jgi:archaetidylinositol phosphate synthase
VLPNIVCGAEGWIRCGWQNVERAMTDLYAVHVSPIGETSATKRIQTNILAIRERHLLNWICSKIPPNIKPDHLTLLGALGAILVFLGYVAGRINTAFLALSVAGYILNWFGDSVDGSLARYRRIERKRYGYFLDHSVDTISIFLILLGVGVSGYVRLGVAMFALIGYFLMCIHVFLAKPVTGRFKLAFCYMGPTELRIGLIALTLFMGTGASKIEIYGIPLLDGVLIATTVVLFFIFVFQTVSVLRELNVLDRAGSAEEYVSNGPDDTRFWQTIASVQRVSKNS